MRITPVLLTLALSQVSSALTSSASNLVISLTSGRFQGAPTNDGTERWLGIPFALPPTGSRRFKAPVAITSAPGTIQSATRFGNVCPQLPSSSLGAPMAEDCLVLNVSAAIFLIKRACANVVDLRFGGRRVLRAVQNSPYWCGSMWVYASYDLDVVTDGSQGWSV